jgi:hypothetical protein
VFLLGEVDCGFVIWLRAERQSIPIERSFEESLRAYTDFLAELKANGHDSLIVCAVPPPTIGDGIPLGEVASIRRPVRATQRERTELTIHYNSRLHLWCEETGMYFVDWFADVVEPASTLVADRFLNPDPLDHHLDSSAFAEILAPHLRETLAMIRKGNA